MSGSFIKKIAQYIIVPIILISINYSTTFAQNESQNYNTQISKTIENLIEEGYNPLPCKRPECSKHLWKKTADGNYSNIHQIDSTTYFVEVTNPRNIAANKKSTGLASFLSQFSKLELSKIDLNENHIITNHELLRYRTKLINNKQKIKSTKHKL